MSAKIDTYIAAQILKGNLCMYIQHYGLNDYMCIELPKNLVVYYV